MFPEVLEAEGVKSQYIQRSIPGSSRWTALAGSGVCRGLHTAADGELYAVYGPTLWHISSKKVATSLINIGSGASKVSMKSNGFVMKVCDGQGMWTVDLTTREVVADTTPFSNPKQLEYFGGRFICICDDESFADNEEDQAIAEVARNNNKFFYSTLNKPEEWLALSSYSAEMGGDPISAIAVVGTEMWVFGQASNEPWRYTGDATSPFEKAQGAGGWVGCYSKDSVAVIGNKLIWLGSGKDGYARVWTNGSAYESVKMSTTQIDQRLTATKDSNTTLSDAVGFTTSLSGHTFYVLTFINADYTLAYDITTNKWFEISSRHPTLGTKQRWNYMFSTIAYDQAFVADERNPWIMQLSLSVYQEYDNVAGSELPITRLMRGPIIWNDNASFTINELLIDMETGVGLTTGAYTNPMCMIRVSRDAHTFNPMQMLPMGKVGEYRTTVRKRGLGTSKRFVIEFSVSAPVKTVILGARIDAEPTNKR